MFNDINTITAWINEHSPALLKQVQEYETVMFEQAQRRKAIIKLAQSLAVDQTCDYIAIPGRLYVGPDVDNTHWVCVFGNQSNNPRIQMERDGKRSSMRRPRVSKSPKSVQKHRPA